jgi:hypothetical protein
MGKRELLDTKAGYYHTWGNESFWIPKLVITTLGESRASGYQSWLFPHMGKRELLDTKAGYSQTWGNENFWIPRLVIPRHGETRASRHQGWLFPDMEKQELLAWENESF